MQICKGIPQCRQSAALNLICALLLFASQTNYKFARYVRCPCHVELGDVSVMLHFVGIVIQMIRSRELGPVVIARQSSAVRLVLIDQ